MTEKWRHSGKKSEHRAACGAERPGPAMESTARDDSSADQWLTCKAGAFTIWTSFMPWQSDPSHCPCIVPSMVMVLPFRLICIWTEPVGCRRVGQGKFVIPNARIPRRRAFLADFQRGWRAGDDRPRAGRVRLGQIEALGQLFARQAFLEDMRRGGARHRGVHRRLEFWRVAQVKGCSMRFHQWETDRSSAIASSLATGRDSAFRGRSRRAEASVKAAAPAATNKREFFDMA